MIASSTTSRRPAAFAKALRKAAAELKNQPSYCWDYACNCNCGFVFQALLKVSPEELRTLVMSYFDHEWAGHSWTNQSRLATAFQVGKIENPLFIKLRKLGVEDADFFGLEFLGYSHLRAKVINQLNARKGFLARFFYRFNPIDELSKSNPDHVQLYLEVWADEIEEHNEQLRLEAVEVRPLVEHDFSSTACV